MRDSQRANFLIALSLVAILGSAAVYASIILSWLHKASAGPRKASSKTVSADLASARRQFRDHLLDAQAALALSESLYRANRPVDSFYVELWAQSFYGPSSFEQAHDAVVLRRENFLKGSPYDPSPASERALRQEVSAEPGHAGAWNYLAHIDADRSDFKAALQDVSQGLAASPEDRGLLFYKAWLTEASDPVDAIELYVRIVSAQPDSYEGRQSLQELQKLAAIKDDGSSETPADAREALQELLQAKPDNPFIFAALALSAWDRGDGGAARAMIAQTLSQRPKQAGALMADGVLAWSQGDIDLALKRFAAAFEKNPEDVVSAQKLAEAFDKQGISREASLPYYIALYRQNPAEADGQPIEDTIQEILDARGVEMTASADPAAIDRLLESEDASLRAQACVRAGELQDPRFLDALGALLDDDTEPVRRRAREAFLKIARLFPDAALARREALLSDERPLVRSGALSVFAELNWSQSFPLAVRALKDPNPAVRFFAHSVLLRHGHGRPETTKALAEYRTQEKDPEVLARYGMMGEKAEILR